MSLKYNGITFKSKPELEMAKHLDSLGIHWNYENFVIKYTIEHEYTPDFYLTDFDMFLEVKGKLDAETRRKHKAVMQQSPADKIMFAFQKGSNKIRKGSQTTYMDWAQKENIQAWDMDKGLFSMEQLKDLHDRHNKE